MRYAAPCSNAGVCSAITELPLANFPAMFLARLDSNAVVTRLPSMPNRSDRAYEGATPFTGPWRVIGIGKDGQRPQDLPLLKSLK